MLKIEEIKITDSGSLQGTLKAINPTKKAHSKIKSNVLKIYSITEINNGDINKNVIPNKKHIRV